MAESNRDRDAWLNAHPEDRWVFNKLLLADRMGYMCGPAEVPIPEPGRYIVRPTMNLSGMGAEARIRTLPKGHVRIPPGHFWCEYFEGPHYSVDFHWGKADSAFRGYRAKGEDHDLYRFSVWQRVELDDNGFSPLRTPTWLEGEYEWINAEFIGGKLIELHLRKGHTGPMENHDTLLVSWERDKKSPGDGWTFVEDYDDADGYLPEARMGFWVKSRAEEIVKTGSMAGAS